MDGRRFDQWTKTLNGGATRRTALKTMAGGAIASALAALGIGGVAAQDDDRCRRTGRNCRRDEQCCSNRCRQGRCICLQNGATCTTDKACCSRRCRIAAGETEGECRGD